MSEKIWKFIEKNKVIIFLAIITIISIAIRMYSIDIESGDYCQFLEPWFNELKDNGGLSALNMDIGNYNAPYMTILAILTYLPIEPIISIKMVSIIFDYICAIGAMILVNKMLKNKKNAQFVSIITYMIVLFLPTVIMNSSMWAQADSIYTAFVILALASLIDEKYLRSFVFLGVAFSFKLQFIFVLPIFILVYISKRKFPLYYFLIIPLVNFAMCIPSMIFGKTLSSCIDVYVNQAGQYSAYLSLNFPSVYNIFFGTNNNFVIAPNEFIAKIGILITIFIFAMVAFIVLYKKIEFNKKMILDFALWSVMICTFLLPHMHDRYLFIGDILSIAYFIVNRDKIYVPICINLISLYTYSCFLYGVPKIPIEYVSIVYLVVIILFTKDIFKEDLKVEMSKEQNIY